MWSCLFQCSALNIQYLAVYFLCVGWMLTGQTTRLYLCDTEPNKCSWYHAQKQDLALQRSAVQCQHSLRSCSSKTVAMPSLCSVCGGGKPLCQTVGSLQRCFTQITFHYDRSYACVLCVFMYICWQTEFSHSGRIKWIKCYSLNLISASPPNWSWLLYLYWPWRGVQTLDLVMLTPPNILRTLQIPGHENLIVTQ